MAEKINILISDTDYLMNFSNALSACLGNDYEISSFSDSDIYLSDNSEPSLLIASDDEAFREIINSHKGHILLLGKDEHESHVNGDVLSVYNPVSTIIGKIYEIFEEGSENDDGTSDESDDSTPEIICIMGFCGVHERNEYSMNTARAESAKGRVLYINMDEFSPLRNDLSVPLDTDISDALYIYRENGFVYTDKLQSVINSYGEFDVIMPTACPDDLCETDAETLSRLVRDIGGNMGYREVIIDVGCTVYKYWEMIGISDRTYIIFDEKERNRQALLFEYLEKTDRSSYIRKTVCLPTECEDE